MARGIAVNYRGSVVRMNRDRALKLIEEGEATSLSPDDDRGETAAFESAADTSKPASKTTVAKPKGK